MQLYLLMKFSFSLFPECHCRHPLISLTSHSFIFVLPPHQGLPSVLPPLPKRPALEKANGATNMFNAGVFQYQQALANMQFQQQAAFIPSGKRGAFFGPMFVAAFPSLVAVKSHVVSHQHPRLSSGIKMAE